MKLFLLFKRAASIREFTAPIRMAMSSNHCPKSLQGEREGIGPADLSSQLEDWFDSAVAREVRPIPSAR
jgi:hypothetical protein